MALDDAASDQIKLKQLIRPKSQLTQTVSN
jgi:hypothetical protein